MMLKGHAPSFDPLSAELESGLLRGSAASIN